MRCIRDIRVHPIINSNDPGKARKKRNKKNSIGDDRIGHNGTQCIYQRFEKIRYFRRHRENVKAS